VADTATKIGIGLSIAGAALGIVGIAIALRDRSKSAGVGLGRAKPVHPIDRRRAGGMTMNIYSDARMPLEMRVAIIQDMVEVGMKRDDMRDLAQAIVGQGARRVRVGKYTNDVQGAGCAPGDQMCKADAIGRWTAENIRYSGDIAPIKFGRNGPVEGIDLFQAGHRTVEMGAEDCDGQATLNATLAAHAGLHAYHKITAPRPASEWSHIYSTVDVGGRQIALDTTLPGYRTGREAPNGRSVMFPARRR
jgi:hypothetical protein